MQDYSQILNARGWTCPAAPQNALPTAETDYHASVEAALGVVCHPDYPAGMVLWLGQAYPFLYRKLIDTIPNELHQLWSEHQPLDQFEHVLREWISTHQQGCALYRKAKQNS